MKIAISFLFSAIMLAYHLDLNASGREEYASDMKKMKSKVQRSEKFSAEVQVINKSIGSFSPVIKAVIHKDGSKFYYKVMHLEFLFNQHRTIMVDHKKNVISCSTADGKFMKQAEQWMPSIDSILMLNDSIIYKGLVDGKKKYCIYKANEMIKYAEVYFDPSLDFFTKVTYSYNKDFIGDDGSVTVEYKAVSFNPVFNATEFNEGRFIKQQGKEIVPVAVYKDYEISIANTDVTNY